jgi:ATP-binding cassette subfamily B protein
MTFGRVFRFAWSYWWRWPKTVATLILAMAVIVAVDVCIPVFAGRLVDALSSGQGAGPALRALCWIMGLGLALTLILNASYALWSWHASNFMKLMVADAFARVQRLSTDWHPNSFSGATVRKITRGMTGMDFFGDTILTQLFPAALVLIGVTGTMVMRWPVMGLFVGATALCYLSVTIGLGQFYIGPANREANRQDSALGAALSDAIGCNAAIKSFGAEAREEERLGGVLGQWSRLMLRAWYRMCATGLAQQSMALVLQGGILGIALWLWSQGRASAGDVAYVLTSYFLINGNLRNVGLQVRQVQKSANDLEDLVHFAEMEPEIRDLPEARPLAVQRGEIRFEKVGFCYGGAETPLYSDFSLTIRPGERIALVGASGSGKSTFVKLLQRLYEASSGRILIDGQDIAAVDQASLRRHIALVPQEPLLFHRSLAENLAYGRPDATSAEIEEAARRAHAHAFIRRLPEGYDTLVGERGVKLSGGERQRVAIARAVLADAPILVMDEATSSLDSVSEALIQEAMERLMTGRTSIMIAHRLSTIMRCDRILVFDKGRVIEEGTHHALMARQGGVYRRLFEMQALGLLEDGAHRPMAAE